MAKDSIWVKMMQKNGHQTDIEVEDTTIVISGSNPVVMRDAVQDASFYAERVVIQDGVREIGPSCFREFYSLIDVILPDTLEIIDSSAFFRSGIKELELPDSVISIGMSFLAETRVEELTLPSRLIRAPNFFIEKSGVKTVKMSKSQFDQTILYALRHNFRTGNYKPFYNTAFLEKIVIDEKEYGSKELKEYLLGKYDLFDEKGYSLKGQISKNWFTISSMFSNSHNFNDF